MARNFLMNGAKLMGTEKKYCKPEVKKIKIYASPRIGRAEIGVNGPCLSGECMEAYRSLDAGNRRPKGHKFREKDMKKVERKALCP